VQLPPLARIGTSLAIGAGAGVTLGLLDEPESMGSAASRVAVGASIAGVASGFMLRGASGYVATGSAMLGATLVGFGLSHLAQQ
jgi:hypothetical protein